MKNREKNQTNFGAFFFLWILFTCSILILSTCDHKPNIRNQTNNYQNLNKESQNSGYSEHKDSSYGYNDEALDTLDSFGVSPQEAREVENLMKYGGYRE